MLTFQALVCNGGGQGEWKDQGGKGEEGHIGRNVSNGVGDEAALCTHFPGSGLQGEGARGVEGSWGERGGVTHC